MRIRVNFITKGRLALALAVTNGISWTAAPAADLSPTSAAAMVGADLHEEHGATSASFDARANTYIAVYYSPTIGNWGWGRSNDLELAKVIARGYCNDNSCQYIFWTQNACAVLAVGTDLGYGWAWNTDRLSAVQNALQNCSNFAVSCKVVVNECT